MCVSKDKSKAIVGCYVQRADVNSTPTPLKLSGLDPNKKYSIHKTEYFGDELMYIGLKLTKENGFDFTVEADYTSFVFEVTE